MNNIVNTRISIRNDELSNWVSSDVTLLKGELALARRPGESGEEGAGTYELRIGVGNKKWQELDPGNFAISASQVIGLSNTVSELSTTHYEASSFDQLSDYSAYNNGDTAVVKELIAGEGADAKYSYTAYVWNSELTDDNKWAAMDGNYRADNVYFDQDISCAGNYTEVGNITKSKTGTTVISASGKSLEKVMETIFTKELTGTTTKPSVTINTNTQNVEYGTPLSVNYQITFSHGSYQYGPSPTGTQLSAWNVKTNGNVLDYTGISNDVITSSDVAANPSAITATFAGDTTLTANFYQVSATAGYTEASAVPNTNLGNPDDTASNFISAGTTAAAAKNLYTVYRPRYVMITNAATDAPTSFTASELSGGNKISGSSVSITSFNEWYVMTDASWPTVINVKNNYYNVFFAAPKGIKSNWTAKKSDNVNVLPTSETPSDATMTYLNGDTGTYSVYQINNATPYDDNKCNITWVN